LLHLDVILIFPNRLKIKCGEIITGTPDPNGRTKGAFRYTPEYLQHPDAFPLDPVNLPLDPKEFLSNRPQGIHGVFEDALPDDWGRKILARKANLTLREQTEPIEAATLALARNAGLNIPEFKLIPVGSRNTLLVKRFDDPGSIRLAGYF
jgi:HipA-like protein